MVPTFLLPGILKPPWWWTTTAQITPTPSLASPPSHKPTGGGEKCASLRGDKVAKSGLLQRLFNRQQCTLIVHIYLPSNHLHTNPSIRPCPLIRAHLHPNSFKIYFATSNPPFRPSYLLSYSSINCHPPPPPVFLPSCRAADLPVHPSAHQFLYPSNAWSIQLPNVFIDLLM